MPLPINHPMPASISISHIQGTPLYVVPDPNPSYGRVYGSKWVAGLGAWILPAFHPFSELVEEDLNVLKDVEFEWTPEARAWADEQATYPKRIADRALHPDFKFVTKPYDHQVESTAFAVHTLRCFLALSMGAGKTKTAVDTLRHVNQFQGGAKALVVVPRVILHKWAVEVTLHSGGELKPVVIDGTPKKKAKLLAEPADVYICTYGTASRMQEKIVEVPYNTLVVDESHNLQSHNSDKTKAVTYLSRRAPRRILMSGTAALGDPRHLWGQFSVAAPFMMEENFWKFCWRYVKYADAQRRVVVGYKNLDILSDRLNRIAIQKTKEECLDLPDRVMEVVKYQLTGKQRAAYNELVTAQFWEAAKMLRVPEEAAPATKLTKLLQICSGYVNHSNKDPDICDKCPRLGACVDEETKPYTPKCSVVTKAPAPTVEEYPENPKLAACKELLDMQLVDSTAKSVVWCHFLHELDHLEGAMEDMGVGYVRVDGSVSASAMQEAVRKFQNNPACRVYLGQMATGIGIDLVAANYNIFYSLDYDLGHYLQALDRSHRIGQTRKVTVYTMLGEGSVEEGVYAALQAKEDIRSALMSKDPESRGEYIRAITRPQEL